MGGLPTSCSSAPQASVFEHPGGKFVEQKQGVREDVAFGMELGRLLDSLHGGDFGQDFGQEAGRIEQFKSAAGAAFGEHLGQFFAHALAGDLVNLRRQLLDCRHGCGIDLEIEARGKTHGAQHAQFVFGKAAFGIADGAHDSGLQIVAAADKIQNFVGCRIEHHAIDGEIAALRRLRAGLW